jgi:hypothetical protein
MDMSRGRVQIWNGSLNIFFRQFDPAGKAQPSGRMIALTAPNCPVIAEDSGGLVGVKLSQSAAEQPAAQYGGGESSQIANYGPAWESTALG